MKTTSERRWNVAEVPNVWLLEIERDDRGWCVTTVTDGHRRVVSRHPDRASAEAAAASVNAAGFPSPGQLGNDGPPGKGVDGS
jgi:hypothetical protein